MRCGVVEEIAAGAGGGMVYLGRNGREKPLEREKKGDSTRRGALGHHQKNRVS